MRIIYIVLILSSSGQSLYAGLPLDWYLRENQESVDFLMQKSGKKNKNPTTDVDQQLDMQIADNVAILDNFSEDERNFSKEKSTWRICNFAFDLGLSLSGTIGVLMAQGQTLVNIYFRRKAQKSLSLKALDSASAVQSLEISEPLSEDEIRERIRPVISGLVATGKIQNVSALRENMFKAASDFSALTAGLNSVANDGGWTPARLRFDFSVSAQGNVSPFIQVGEDIRIRFDWFPKIKNIGLAASFLTPKAEKLRNLLANLAAQLGRVQFESVKMPPGLHLIFMAYSLGITSTGKLGIATTGASAIGTIFMAAPKPSLAVKADSSSQIDEEAIPLIGESSPKQAFTTQSKEDSKIHLIPAQVFQKGMDKALRMGSYFAKHAQAKSTRNWELDQIRAQFVLTLSGSIYLATLGAQAAVQAVFINQ